MHNPTILIVDDTETNIDILVELLEEYNLLVALNGPDALALLEENSVDLVLLDIMMPGMDGYDVCAKIKADEKSAQVPVIFITAKSDEESIEKAFDMGGVDYVTKPFKPKELLARVKSQIKIQTLIDELYTMATRDFMTGIYNRRSYFQKGSELLEKAKKEHTPFSVMMLDLDHFKKINDTYGHDIGDAVIKSFTQTASKFLDGHIFGRIGGEEFAVALNLSPEESFAVAQQIRQNIEAIEIIEEMKLRFTVSIGIASMQSTDQNIDQIMKVADEKLYKVKSTTRNRVEA